MAKTALFPSDEQKASSSGVASSIGATPFIVVTRVPSCDPFSNEYSMPSSFSKQPTFQTNKLNFLTFIYKISTY
jgi:hypothetical protein